MLSQVCRTSRKRIGIIGGSGPDAGIDLMNKIIKTNRKFLGAGAGDKDAPIITLLNIPQIGGPHGSWDLVKGNEANKELVNDILKATETISHTSDYFCIACNTLHKTQIDVESYLKESKISAKFVSIVDTVQNYCAANDIESLVVMGSKMTTDVKDSSPYAPLSKNLELPLLPENVRDMQQTALELIKTKGPNDTETQHHFQKTIDSFDADYVLLGCTEFPLMKVQTEKKLIDPTQLLAERLVALSWGYEDGILPTP